jgi:hypothetical protein
MLHGVNVNILCYLSRECIDFAGKRSTAFRTSILTTLIILTLISPFNGYSGGEFGGGEVSI